MRGAIKLDNVTPFKRRAGVFDPPIEVLEPARQAAPFVFASPHSGRCYPESFLSQSRLDPLALRASEDAYVDELFNAAPGLGAPLISARFPRAYVDPNRDPMELDPEMFDGPLPDAAKTRGPRVAAGLGAIPRLVADGATIYDGRLPAHEAVERLAECHAPYHAALERLLSETRRRFRRAALVDCHSMPSFGVHGAEGRERLRVDVVIGDRYGASCSPALTGLVESALRREGLTVARNTPYAGGWSTERYGRPFTGLHAVQIELNRALYLDEATLERTSGFEELRQALTRMTAALIDDGARCLRP